MTMCDFLHYAPVLEPDLHPCGDAPVIILVFCRVAWEVN